MKVLIIDPNATLSSPSMQGVVRSLPALKARGIEIEVWCWTCEDGLVADRICKLPRVGDVRILGGFVFGWLVFWRAWWLFKVLKRPRPDVVYTVGWYHSDCDICLVQFSPFDWEKRQRVLGIRSLRDLAERALNGLVLVRARRFLRRTTAKRLICVSHAVAEDMRAENPALPIDILPNSYDPARFHPGVRERFRDGTRAALGYDDSHRVFVFVSTGHYRRKGFFLAFDSLRILRREHPEVRFLVVGGRPQRLAALQAELGGGHAWITFTGMVPDVERYFAAADAFLFPSYSEAFALVEVEAAACGLPLFLTPHHGSEMILEDGVNGRLLEFDAARIAAVLAEFVEGRWNSGGHSLKCPLDSETYAARLFDILRQTGG